MQGGSDVRVLDDIFEFTGGTDHDWRALECARANGMATSALFERTCPGAPEDDSWMKSIKQKIIIGNTSRRTNELEEGQQDTTGAATTIVHTFISSRVHLLMLESTPYLLKSATWTVYSHHSCRPQATTGKRSRYQPNRSGSPQPREEHSSLVSKIIQAWRNVSLGGRPERLT